MKVIAAAPSAARTPVSGDLVKVIAFSGYDGFGDGATFYANQAKIGQGGLALSQLGDGP